MGVSRIFLDPRRSVLDLAVDILTREWTSNVLELRNTLIVVPTRNAGRRLRERLATETAKRGAVALMGPLYLPMQLFAPSPTKRIVTELTAQAFWIATLRDAPRNLIEQLIPASSANTLNPLNLAWHITDLRSTLCEEGFTIRTFAQRVTFEQERWHHLAQLEDLYLQKLHEHEYCDDVVEKLETAKHPVIPTDVRRIIVLFTPDPPPLAVVALKTLAEQFPVEICIHADERDAGSFDEWGCPIPSQWSERPCPVTDEQIIVCDDPLDMVERISQLIVDLPHDVRSQVAIGVSERTHAEWITASLAQKDIAIFNPAGKPAATYSLFALLQRLFSFYAQPTFRRFLELACHPHALQRLEEVAGTPLQLVSLLESFQNTHLPATLDSALEIAAKLKATKSPDRITNLSPIIKAFEEVIQWRFILAHSSSLADALDQVLPRIYRNIPVDETLRDAAHVLHSFLKQAEIFRKLGLSFAEQFSLLERGLESVMIVQRRTSAEDIDLLGWLELQWEDAPILILTDMNDGLVPETIPPNPFLPNQSRKAQGMRDNGQRFARDAYVLTSVLRTRSVANIRLFVPRRSRDGNPLKPSRLLLQCPDDSLPRRVLSVFRDIPSSQVFTQRSSGWRIKPPAPSVPMEIPSISISDFRSYLDCPFFHYLKRVMKAEEMQELKNELDVREFGTLCHEILARFGRSSLKDSTDPDIIGKHLQQLADEIVALRFGNSPSPIVQFQLEIIKKRLRAFAYAQAKLRTEGWEITDVEVPIRRIINGTEIKARIDRIDRKENRILIIDYKTTKQAEEPSKTHIAQRSANMPYFALLNSQNDKAWKDLQLPLYAAFYTHSERSADLSRVEVAYFCLPDAPDDTELKSWANWSKELVEDAWYCATQILDRMRHGVFWPPRKDSVPFFLPNSWDRLFFGPVLEYLDEDFALAMAHLTEQYERHQAQRHR